ncbi:hypothetical protein LP420_04230 [Massilia sp. B-10]|nr:hypothetical protein LP420_04230 [Massilia sp. B-10]
MSNLIKYNQARHALAECRNVDEIKDLRDKSEAMRLYAQQARDKELEQWAAEIKLRAQRAIGKLSAALDKKQGNKGKLPSGGKFKTKVLAEAGISTSTANRYEKLATIPESEVEEYITHSKVIGKPVSAMAVLGHTKPKPTKANMPMSDVGITKSSVTGCTSRRCREFIQQHDRASPRPRVNWYRPTVDRNACRKRHVAWADPSAPATDCGADGRGQPGHVAQAGAMRRSGH